jgi:rSAM/selenodomain-associated transferase 2
MSLSIIIPTYNEEESISDLLNHLKAGISSDHESEIIVVDGGSQDKTAEIVESLGIKCIISERKGRAAQMNVGTEASKNDILYFVHADSIPPASFVNDIVESLEMGFQSGCYRYKFDHYYTPLLRINSYCTRFDRLMVRGGDQTLFITRSLFDELGGFREDYRIMEDYDLIEKIQNATNFRIIQKDAIVSSRKYEDNGYFRVQIANLTIFMMYFAGASQDPMCHAYSNMLDYR